MDEFGTQKLHWSNDRRVKSSLQNNEDWVTAREEKLQGSFLNVKL